MRCDICGGMLIFLGRQENLDWVRCRNCGMEFSYESGKRGDKLNYPTVGMKLRTGYIIVQGGGREKATKRSKGQMKVQCNKATVKCGNCEHARPHERVKFGTDETTGKSTYCTMYVKCALSATGTARCNRVRAQ